MATIKLDELTPVVQEEKQLATAGVSALPKGMSGEISSEDIKLPSIRLVGKTSALADEFPSGSWVYDGSIVLSDGKTPFNAIVVRFAKKYQERRAYEDSNDSPVVVVDTLSQVQALGGSLLKDAAKPFMPIAIIQLLIEAPATLDEAERSRFGIEIEGKNYAFALYSANSPTAYNAVGKEIISATANGLLRENLSGAIWKFSSELIKTQKNSWFGPRAEIACATPASILEWIDKR